MRLALPLLFLACGSNPNLGTAQSDLVCAQNICPPNETTLNVPKDIATIQGAIDQIADGGTIRIHAGTYDGHLLVKGKQVHIEGVGHVVLKADGQGPLLAFTSGGGGSVARVKLEPATVGIAGLVANQLGPSEITAHDVKISGAATGIAGDFSLLALSEVKVHGGGIGLKIDSFRNLTAAEVDLFDLSHTGFIVHNNVATPDCRVSASDLHIYDNESGGIAILGDACPIDIYNSQLGSNRIYNMGLFGAGEVNIHGTEATRALSAADGLWGDGVVAFESGPVTIDKSIFSQNDLGGIAAYGCDSTRRSVITLSNTDATCNGGALIGGQIHTGCGVGYELIDGGGLDCSCKGNGALCLVNNGLGDPAPILPP